jgi:cysteine-rich repeat protein
MFRLEWLSAPILIALMAPACTSGSNGSIQDPAIVECSNGPDECPKIEGDEVGTAGVTLEVDGQIITFLSFQPKEGENGEYIGFTLDTAATFVVKAGNTCYSGEGTSWVHPDGTSGPDASAISNIQVCTVDEPEPFCGDGTMDDGEECDDGNNEDGDGCSANCTNEGPGPSCGDGTVDEGEECDDGNNDDGDGCSANCTDEGPGPSCGDGTMDAGEECDDGNNDDGDGCSANCTIEVPEPECGNGVVEPGEQCDDGNDDDNDTCTNDCFIITG